MRTKNELYQEACAPSPAVMGISLVDYPFELLSALL